MGRLRELLERNREPLNSLARIVLIFAAIMLVFLGIHIFVVPGVVIIDNFLAEHIIAGVMVVIGIANICCLFVRKYVDTIAWPLVIMLGFFVCFRIAEIGFNPIAVVFLAFSLVITMAAKVYLTLTR